MSITAVVIITILNTGLFMFLCDVLRRKTYRDRWKYQLIALLGAVFVIEMAMLYTKLMEVVK